MAGLVAFEFGVSEVGEPLGGQRVVGEAGVGDEGRGELADQVAESGAVEAEQASGPDQEVERIGQRPPVEGGRAGWDAPAAVGAPGGGEAEYRPVVQAQEVPSGSAGGSVP